MEGHVLLQLCLIIILSRTTRRDALGHWRKLKIVKKCAKFETRKLNGKLLAILDFNVLLGYILLYVTSKVAPPCHVLTGFTLNAQRYYVRLQSSKCKLPYIGPILYYCVQKNTHSHFLSYPHVSCVDLNKNCGEYTQGMVDSDNLEIRYSN